MDKKPTDAEIVKALECCISDKDDVCLECPLQNDCFANADGNSEVKELALDLINRLQAENESLWLCVYELKREVGRHERNYDPDEDTEKIIKTILAENRIPNTTDKINLKVYKEFVGKFKKEIGGQDDG